jgi:hypothetical protein
MDSKLNQYRKIKKAMGKKYPTNTMGEESKTSDNIKRKNDYDDEPEISVKQKPNLENVGRQKEIMEMNTVKEDEDQHNYEETFDDEWGIFLSFIC